MLDIINITNSSLFILSASESSTAKYHILSSYLDFRWVFRYFINLSTFKKPFRCVFFRRSKLSSRVLRRIWRRLWENLWIFGVAWRHQGLPHSSPWWTNSPFSAETTPLGTSKDVTTCRHVDGSPDMLHPWTVEKDKVCKTASSEQGSVGC